MSQANSAFKASIDCRIWASSCTESIFQNPILRLRLKTPPKIDDLLIRHRIFVGIENESRLRREIVARRTKNIDKPCRTVANVLCRMKHAGGNDQHGRA